MKVTDKLAKYIDKNLLEGKYSKNVAHGLGTALRVFSASSDKKDQNSIDSFKNSLSKIAVKISLGLPEISAGSIATYRSRMNRLIRDYEESHGNTKDKITVVNGIQRAKTDSILRHAIHKPVRGSSLEVHKLEIALQSGSSISLILPKTMTRHDVEIVKSILDSLCAK